MKTLLTIILVLLSETYLVRFLNYDNTLLQSDQLEEGTIPVYTGAIPTRPGSGGYSYNFIGWDKALSPVQANTDYVARYNEMCAVYVSSDAHGMVTVGDGAPAGTYMWDLNSTHHLSATSIDACYEFDSWSDGSTEQNREYMVTQPASLMAQFRLRTVPMTFGVGRVDSLHGTVVVETALDEITVEGLDTTLYLTCGDVVEVTAKPARDYHFVRWSDGSKSAHRRATVSDGDTLLAEFAPNCYEYAQWPIVALYDWIIMLNVNEVKDLGYNPKEEDVVWYRVVDQPDDLQASRFPQDDRFVGIGYYLTLDRNLRYTSDYYCVVDVSSARGMLCDSKMRSIIISYSRPASYMPAIGLAPSVASPGETVMLDGIRPEVRTQLWVYDTAGRLVVSAESEGAEKMALPAISQPGCYTLRVENAQQSQVLRFIISR